MSETGMGMEMTREQDEEDGKMDVDSVVELYAGVCCFFICCFFLLLRFFPVSSPFFTSFPCRKADICAYTVVYNLFTLHLVHDANIYCSPHMQHADMMHTHATLKSRRPPTPMPVSLRDSVYKGARYATALRRT